MSLLSRRCAAPLRFTARITSLRTREVTAP